MHGPTGFFCFALVGVSHQTAERVALKHWVHFYPRTGIFAQGGQFSPAALAEGIRTPSAGDLLNVH